MNQMSFTIVNNTICPDWYLNLRPLDLQSNTQPLCHGGCWHLVLITLVGLFNDSFAISRTAYLLLLVATAESRATYLLTAVYVCLFAWLVGWLAVDSSSFFNLISSIATRRLKNFQFLLFTAR